MNLAQLMALDPVVRGLHDNWQKANGAKSMAVPKDLQGRRDFFALVETRDAEVNVNDPEGGDITFQATISTYEIDRYSTIIEPRGADLTNFRKNPVLLWSHGLDPTVGYMAIGSIASLDVFDERIDVAGYFFGDQELSRSIGEMYRKKQLRGFSIGFIPRTYRFDQIGGREILRFLEWELVELSAVSVPANASALAKAVGTGDVNLIDQRIAQHLANCIECVEASGDPLDLVCRFTPKLGRTMSSASNDGEDPNEKPDPNPGESHNAPGNHEGERSATPTRIKTEAPAASCGCDRRTEDVTIRVPVEVAQRLRQAGQVRLDVPRGAGWTDANGENPNSSGDDISEPNPDGLAEGEVRDLAAESVVWDGAFNVADILRAYDGNPDDLAALTIERDGQAFRTFVHHRDAETVHWPALAACMGRLLTVPGNLTRDQRGAIYDHLARHYNELGIAPPEAKAHNWEQAVDLALQGRIALIDRSGNAWLYREAVALDNATKARFFNVEHPETTFDMEAPTTVGRMSNPELWGRRIVPDPTGLEATIQSLANHTRQLTEIAQQRAGAKFSQATRGKLGSLADSIGKIAKAIRQTPGELRDLENQIRQLIANDEGSEGDEERQAATPTSRAELDQENGAGPGHVASRNSGRATTDAADGHPNAGNLQRLIGTIVDSEVETARQQRSRRSTAG